MYYPLKQGESVLLKPYSSQELADLYGVNIKTFKKWLCPFDKRIGKRVGRYYTVAQVMMIFECLGVPNMTINPEYMNPAHPAL